VPAADDVEVAVAVDVSVEVAVSVVVAGGAAAAGRAGGLIPEGPEITCTGWATGAAGAAEGAAAGAAEAAGVLSAGCISTTQPAETNRTPVIMSALVDKVFTLASQV
jgi:hypothetical protein